MKTRSLFLSLFAVLAVILLGACSAAGAGTLPPRDLAGLVAALEESGVDVEQLEPITQPFFSPEGQVLRINGQEIQVFEYVDEAAADQDAATVSPDGSSTTTTMITWMDSPHFYKAGKLIAIYVGGDLATLTLLESLLGPQFAGQ